MRLFEFIYACLVNGLGGNEITAAAFEDYLFDEQQSQLVECYVQNMGAYKEAIISHLKQSWTWDRVPFVDRAIILEAICESQVWKTPKKVLIDQAVTTAKHYGEEDSYKFINGLLEQVLS